MALETDAQLLVAAPSLETLEKLVQFVDDYFALPEQVRITLSNAAAEPPEGGVAAALRSLAAFAERWAPELEDLSTEHGAMLHRALLKPGEARRVASDLGSELADMKALLARVTEQVGQRAAKAQSQVRRALGLNGEE